MDPYLREYIFFLNTWDPARFSVARIAERYRLRSKTVEKVVSEFAHDYRLRMGGLSSRKRQVITRAQKVEDAKEREFSKRVGWDQMGDGEENVHEEDEEFRGPRGTSDWIRRQTVEVEMMSAYPLGQNRNPMPKRVDVDMVVSQTRTHKIMAWIDPEDKVTF